METAVKTFFTSPYFAVVGASQNPAKFGHKVFAWYVAHSLPASPINPTSPAIDLASTSHPTVASVSELPSPKETSLSIITPPFVTIKVLEEAKAAGVPAVWLQPGTFDDKVLSFAKKEFQAAIGGDGGGGSEGWCILVDGEWGLDLAARKWRKQKI